MNNNRYASIGVNTLENHRFIRIERISNNSNRNGYNEYINENTVACHFNKTKIIILLIITIILSLSNYFYNWNNNISIIVDEPKTILSLFDNNIFKYNSPLTEPKKYAKSRNLKEEKNKNNNFNDDKFEKFDIYNKNYLLMKEYEIKKKIFSSMDKMVYKFNWNSSNYKIGESSYGEGLFTIKKKTQIFSDSIRITMKINENSFIDNWLIQVSDSSIEDISFKKEKRNNDNNLLKLIGTFITTAYEGKFFDIINEDEPMICQTHYTINCPFSEKNNLDMNNKNHTLIIENLENKENIFLNINNISMILDSTCGFNIKLEAYIYNKTSEQNEIENKINTYCLITALSCLFYCIGIYSIIYNINRSENVISVISSDCLVINPIFNTYITLVDINIAMRLNNNHYPLLLMICFTVVKFIYLDFYLLALYWKKKRNNQGLNVYIKEKLRFYLVYYLISFCSFLWIYAFFNYFFIMILCICLWIPQIIFNVKKNNKYGYPFIYILSSTIDKLIYPIYFRAYKDNFIGCKVNPSLIAFMILFVVFTIAILYMQILYEPRFFMPKSYHSNEFNFYKTKSELLKIKSDIGSEECVICLNTIFEIDKDIMIEMVDKSEKNNNNDKYNKEEKLDDTIDSSENTNNKEQDDGDENDKIIDNNNNGKEEILHNIPLMKENNNKKNSNWNNIWFIIKLLFYDNFFLFYKKNCGTYKGLYMLTPCSHVFHAECLEKWFEFKKECPNCRISMKEYLE